MSPSSETVRIIRVFVSSPGDVAKEREVLDDVVSSINKTDGQRGQFRLDLFRWEDDVTPQIGPRPQIVVDQQTPSYDIYLGIMSTRFGTPTERAGSGTESEFRDALQSWESTGTPWITFYFDDAPKASRKPEEVKQYLKVCEFREELEGKGIVAGYTGVRGNRDAFYEKVDLHLRTIVPKLLKPAVPATPDASPEPNTKTRTKPSVPANYTGWLLSRCGEMELMGMELKHGVGVRLNHVYVPLATSAGTAERENTESLQREDAGFPMSEGHESRKLLLELLNKRSLYVSGDPGSGKSTFCRWVTWLACNGALPPADVPAPKEYSETFPDQLRGRLPVLVRLRDFWQHLPVAGVRTVGLGGLEQALQDWLTSQRLPGLDWACLKGHMEQGSALLMLDGVDEVPPIRGDKTGEWYPREMLLTGLGEAVRRWTEAGNRLLVTSRPYGLAAGQHERLGLTDAPILGLDRPLQSLLIRRWFVRLKESRDLGLETSGAMIDHLHVEAGLDELAANPLLLTAMCIIYDQGKRLPHDKYVLYDRIVDTVLHKRYAERERTDPIRGRLAAVALGMHTGDGLGQKRAAPEATASESEIDLLLQAYQRVDGSIDQGLSDTVRAREDLLSQSGLLVARGDREASFYHLSIQEFLAAERLFLLGGRERQGFVELLLARGTSPGWRNTLSFLFGCLIEKFSPHLGVEWLEDLVGRVSLPDVDPARRGQEGGIWNLALVLGDCLQILVGREVTVPEDLQVFFRTCVLRAIEQEIPIRQRHNLAVAMGRLGDPRIVGDLRIRAHPEGHPGYVKIPPGTYRVGDEKEPFGLTEPFWLSRYPVTNSQYAYFVADRGYARRELWSDEGWRWLEEAESKGAGSRSPDDQEPGSRTPVSPVRGSLTPSLWRDPAYNAPNQPVVGVSFWEAEAFCRWAGGRLPAEREWEAAARGTQGREYPWSDAWEDGICNSFEAGLGGTSAVGVFPRSRSAELQLEDMAGNVWEWCHDLLGATGRVIRGGCWWDYARRCRAADRSGSVPGGRAVILGFRVAAVLSSQPGSAPSSGGAGANGGA